MVMYDGTKSEDMLKHFFADVYGLYLKVRRACLRPREPVRVCAC